MIRTVLFSLLAVVAVAVLVVLALASRKPDTFRIERSILIVAPADAIFPHIDDLRAWTQWSAYEAKDPQMQREHSGAARGVGAVYAWDGNSAGGAGRMEIVESQPPSRVRMTLDFERPMEAHNTAEFNLAPEAGGTRVTWVMHGPAPFLSKVMQTVFDMDRMIGRDFEAGLSNLKTRVESGATPQTHQEPTA